MKRLATVALTTLCALGLGVPLAHAAGAGTVPIRDLTLLEESGDVTTTVALDYGGRGGGHRGGYYGGHHGGYHGGYHHGRSSVTTSAVEMPSPDIDMER